jgi:hypothetical protein
VTVTGEAQLFALGPWSEAPRLAAQARRVDFFARGGPGLRAVDGLLDAFERLPSEDRADAGATVERLRWLQRTGASVVAVAGWLDSAVTQLSP